MSTAAGTVMGRRVPNPIYFADAFYRLAIVTAVALTVISAIVGAFCFQLGSSGFFAMALTSGIGFSVVALLIVRGCIKTTSADEAKKPL